VARNKEEYDYHGLPWSDLPVSEYSHPGPGFCALDVYYYAAEQKKPDSWFRDRKPLARVGKTFYVFEVPAS